MPLVEALEQMPRYVKFMKDLLTKKRTVSYEMVDNLHHYSAIAIRFIIQKKADLGAFTVPCTIGSLNFKRALCDLGASINLMPLAFFKKLGLVDPTPTNICLLMADGSVKRPIGIRHDVLVRVANFKFPADFIILDCEVDFEVHIIFVRPLLANGRVLVGLELNKLKFRFNGKEVSFEVGKYTKQQKEMSVFLIIDAFYEDEVKMVLSMYLDEV
ncbi:uncharacterized protein LOC107844354 [Capsicum annuum]|uniref:uncharacterized protein LOC107844354 n=1 Tax=Capsicum annuum TaxID=4072 RepID=UPI001FB0625D|nr:uncharacterized protein LOC107844354 [Capsicum annuum]